MVTEEMLLLKEEASLSPPPPRRSRRGYRRTSSQWCVLGQVIFAPPQHEGPMSAHQKVIGWFWGGGANIAALTRQSCSQIKVLMRPSSALVGV